MLCQAMDSGIFDIVAHPDIFMQYRDSMDSESKKELFMENAKIASQMICEKAKELGIPLELNLEGARKNETFNDGQFGYPHSEFWEIAAETGVMVLYGVDAHSPEHFATMDEVKEQIDAIIDSEKLNLVDKNYNPVEARKNNEKLNELYKQSQAASLTYETHLITQIISGVIDQIPDKEFNPETFSYVSEYAFEKIAKTAEEKDSKKRRESAETIEQISKKSTPTTEEETSKDSTSSTEEHPPKTTALTTEEKKFTLNRAKDSIEHSKETLAKQQAALSRAKDSIHTSIEIGCRSKQDFKSTITQITEAKTTKTPTKKDAIASSLVTTQAQSNKTAEKGHSLVKKANNTNNSNGTKGFSNVFSISLIITLICTIGIILGYFLHKISIK